MTEVKNIEMLTTNLLLENPEGNIAPTEFKIALCSIINFHANGIEYELSPSTIQEDITPHEAALMSFVLCFLTTASFGFDWSTIPDNFFRHMKRK